MALEFSLETGTDPVIIRLAGGLTLGPQLTRFARTVDTFLQSRRVSGIVLELGGIVEIDSAGLGELVVLYTSSSEAGCRLCLVQPTARVLRLLEMTRLSGLLPHFEDAESAISWIRSG